MESNFDKNILSFLASIEPTCSAYQDATFTYLGIRDKNKCILVAARIHLVSNYLDSPPPVFRSETVCVGRVKISETKFDLRSFIQQILSGVVQVHDLNLYFQKPDNGRYNTYHNRFHELGLQDQRRINVLSITASGSWNYLNQPSLDWELMASDTPYNSLNELVSEYSLGPITNYNNNCSVEIIAFNILEIIRTSSIENNKAQVTLSLHHKLEKNNAALGYTILKHGKTVKREKLLGEGLIWETDGSNLSAMVEIDVNDGELIHCIAIYSGVTQHHYWIADSTKTINPRFAAFETFDDDLRILYEVLNDQTRKKNARDLESAVSWLFWLMGFSPVQIDLPRMQDAPDLIVSTPQGNFAIIECTTGLLKADNKLPNLHSRAQAVVNSLEKSSLNYFKVLPIIVTTKKLKDIEPEIEQAQRHGILVLTREDLIEQAEKLRYRYLADADQTFYEAIKQVQTIRAKFEKRDN